jgi:hypothetical protein
MVPSAEAREREGSNTRTLNRFLPHMRTTNSQQHRRSLYALEYDQYTWKIARMEGNDREGGSKGLNVVHGSLRGLSTVIAFCS